MPTLYELVQAKRENDGISYEKMAYQAGMSRNQFTNVAKEGFSDGTRLETIRGFARVLGMEVWELLRVLATEESNHPAPPTLP